MAFPAAERYDRLPANAFRGQKSRQNPPDNPRSSSLTSLLTIDIISLRLLRSHRLMSFNTNGERSHRERGKSALFVWRADSATPGLHSNAQRDSIFMNPAINKSSLQSLRLPLLPLRPPATAAQRRGSKNPSGVTEELLEATLQSPLRPLSFPRAAFRVPERERTYFLTSDWI